MPKNKQQKPEKLRTQVDDKAAELIAEPVRSGFWHRLNVCWPWLKLAPLILVIVLVVLAHLMTQQATDVVTSSKNFATYDDLNLAPPPTPPVEQRDFTDKKLIALTFDDGPSRNTTPQLLQILAEKQVKVTFFVVGTMARQNPDILKQEELAGHEVGSHTVAHQSLTKMTFEAVQADMTQMNSLFQQTLGHQIGLLRPPYGANNAAVRSAVGVPLILWTVDPEDWRYRDAAKVRAGVTGAAFDGAIILLHDIHASTVSAVGGIIDDLRAAGYEFLTVSELAKARGVTMQPGVNYGSFRP